MSNPMTTRWYDEELYTGLVDTSHPLRIVHVCKYFPPERGGMETYARDLAFEQARAGHTVMALAHSRQASRCTTPVPQCEVVSSKILFHAGTYVPVAPGLPFQLRKALNGKPHILHLHAPNPAALWCLLFAGANCTKLVVHWHADVLFPEHKKPFAPALALWRAMEQRLLARADRIIATSTPYLESSGFLGPWRPKCVVAPLRLAEQRQPVSTDVRHPAVDFLRGSEGNTQRSVLAVGRLAHYKGFDVLLKAVAQAPELRCCIIGEGEEGANLRNLAHNLQLEDRVFFPGTVEDDVITACYNACDVFCLPSILRTEAFGIVLLEALRAGKWCVASNVPGSGMSTVIQHGQNGWLVKPGDVGGLVEALQVNELRVP